MPLREPQACIVKEIVWFPPIFTPIVTQEHLANSCPIFHRTNFRQLLARFVIQLLRIDHHMVGIHLHCVIVVRHRQPKSFAIEFFQSAHSPEEIDDALESNAHTVDVLSVSDFERLSVAFGFTRYEREEIYHRGPYTWRVTQ